MAGKSKAFDQAPNIEFKKFGVFGFMDGSKNAKLF
jgi:hypothetical protein